MPRQPKPVNAQQFARALGWIMPGLLGLWIIGRAFLWSPARLLWLDELLTWYPASASFGRMIASTTDTINASPPLYFILIWVWSHIVGNSALMLRLFSALTTAGAWWVMFAVLRRRYGAIAAFAGIISTATNALLLARSYEARFYPLFLAEMAVALWIYGKMIGQARPSPRLLAANSLVQAALIMTHYFAIPYIGALVVATIMIRLSQRKPPWRELLSYFAGVAVLGLWLPALLGQSKTTSWIQTPDATTLWQYFHPYVGQIFITVGLGAIVFATVLGLISLRSPRAGNRRRWVRPGDAPMLLVGLGLLYVPFVAYFLSRLPGAPSLFLGRYFVPSLLGWSIVTAHATCWLLRSSRSRNSRATLRFAASIQFLALAFFLAQYIYKDWSLGSRQPKASINNAVAKLPAVHDVVITNIHDFMAVHFYAPQAIRFKFVADLEVAARGDGQDVPRHRIMLALKRHFPEQFQTVMTTSEFLASEHVFWARPGPWIQSRVIPTHQFAVVERRGNQWLFQRKP